MYSHTSLLQATPPSPTFLRPTSAPISSVIARSSEHARNIKASSRRPKMRDTRCIGVSLPACTAVRSLGLGKEFPELRPVLRALPYDPGPGRLVGLCKIGLGVCALEFDRFGSGPLFPLRILGFFRGLLWGRG